MQEQKKDNEIDFIQIIAGILLNFEEFDEIDVSFIAENFFGVKYDLIDWRRFFEVDNNLIISKNGKIKLKEGYTLNSFLENENRTLKDKFLEMAGDKVRAYFNSFDIEEYKKKKSEIIAQKKQSLLENANVLLISDVQEDYEALKEYGFKNVDYFKSIIRADNYFSRNPNQLNKYDIVLKGNQNVQKCCFHSEVELDNILTELHRDNDASIRANLYHYNLSEDHSEISIYVNCHKTLTNYYDVNSYSQALDGLVKTSIIGMIDNKRLKKTFAPIKDYVNPNRLPIPTKKSNLKILCLVPYLDKKSFEEINKELGLDITFKEDDNNGLGLYIKNNLGNYDIIIASDLYSGNILLMNEESTEQCKDSGRDLTLLLTYDVSNNFDYDNHEKFGTYMELRYICGGNLSEEDKVKFVVFNKLTNSSSNVKYYSKETIQTVIEQAINLYNQKLDRIGKKKLIDCKFKSSEEYNQEYLQFQTQKRQKEVQRLEQFAAFESLKNNIFNYIKYKKLGLISGNLEGLKLKETQEEIYLEVIHEGRILCSIAFPKEESNSNLRIFSIQTLSNKGNLSKPEIVGLYKEKCESLKTYPKQPDENQMKIIIAVKKKVESMTKSLKEEASNKYNLHKDNKREYNKKRCQ